MPITVNLMVETMPRALAFWRDLLGLEVVMAVGADRSVDVAPTDAVFVILRWDGSELMLQEAGSLRAELPGAMAESRTPPTAAIYLRGFDPNAVRDRLDAGRVVKGPVKQWYGMTELYLSDPDGHLVCLGVADGPPPP